ncbi:MAG: hypothetical protein IJP30_02685 [Clostridia bacterium]|nr:hypothetical protein [Clostridia bacterium]
MKKTSIRLFTLLLSMIAVISLAACGGSGSSEPELKTYTTELGLTAKLPEGFTVSVDDQTVSILNEKKGAMLYAIRESFDLFASYNVPEMSLDEYAELVQRANSSDAFTPDANGNPHITYEKLVNGKYYYYYSTVRKGSDAYWVISFTCLSENKADFADIFVEWADLVTVK